MDKMEKRMLETEIELLKMENEHLKFQICEILKKNEDSRLPDLKETDNFEAKMEALKSAAKRVDELVTKSKKARKSSI
uniref:Uncharacterized protein n=1 Tax=Panagrolaimus sp. ES5 TaxID=591445 RepID=A0AC34F6N2_9BILA